MTLSELIQFLQSAVTAARVMPVCAEQDAAGALRELERTMLVQSIDTQCVRLMAPQYRPRLSSNVATEDESEELEGLLAAAMDEAAATDLRWQAMQALKAKVLSYVLRL